ncbi:energy-coupling factor ABC transporter permease [uncultured Abyssibacter sp.]|uniref:energy-coupling factor ABC transporter permease n=1 Tax=uncultured Abyssibacter sp. TaxID=2320202 RepID=UPI0032B255C3|tara:strand:+ start:45 stop:710 length:666 start_codon:yes stop_codon:yes gene_type:complete
MVLADSLLGGSAWLIATLLQALVLLAALRFTPWRLLLAVPARLHLLFGSMTALVLFWQISGQMEPRMQFHLLGMTTVTLILGAPLAILAGTCSQLASALLLGQLPVDQVLPHALINVTAPALTTALLLRVLHRHAPKNPFTYMLGVGFFGGGLSMLSSFVTSLTLLALIGQWRVLDDWLSPLMLLVMFPEGFLNGAIISGLVVYRPEWLKTFDDSHFIDQA